MTTRSVGTIIQIGSTAVAGLTSIGAPPRTADTLDTTTLNNPGGYRTFIGGFKDGGELPISGFFEPDDAGQIALDAAYESGAEMDFLIIFPAPMTASYAFRGVVTALTAGSADLEELLSFESTIKISGKPDLVKVGSAGLSALSLTGTGGALSPATFSNGNHNYTFGGVSATSVTVTATAVDHEIKLYVDGAFVANLTSGAASAAIPLTLNVGKKLTIVAREEGKSPSTYEVIVVKTS